MDWRALLGGILGFFTSALSTLAGAFIGVAFAEPLRIAFEPLFREFTYEKNKENPNLILSPSQLIDAFFRGLYNWDEIKEYLSWWGYGEGAAEALKRVSYSLMAVGYVQDLVNRNMMTPDEGKSYLMMMGFTETDAERLLALRRYIPSVQDMVRFGVREAFTPEIAEKYGQYEDIPPEYIKAASLAGLDEEWARMYWAAHWELPSATQGFEMFHRGIITYDELKLLLRALDVMPFWRDKLIQIAYNVISRIDIRRMYKLGVADEQKVYQTYLALGYTPEDAKLLTQYVVKSAVEEDKDVAKQEILNAYKVGMINDVMARNMLKELGYSDENAYFLISLADYQRHSDEINATISAVRKAYMVGEYTYSQAVAELSRIGVRYDEIQNLIRAWDISKLAEKEYPTKNDIIRWFRYGIMSFEEAYQRLARMGYEPRDIQLLLYDSLTYPSKSDIISLYRQGIIPYEKAYGLLRALGYPDEACEWFLADRPEIPTKAELIRFLRKGIIDLDTFVYLMRRSGYPDEAIGWYIEDIEPKLTKAECDRYLMDGVLSVEGYVRFLRKMGYTDEEITLSIEDIIKRLEAKGKKQQKQQEQQEGGE